MQILQIVKNRKLVITKVFDYNKKAARLIFLTASFEYDYGFQEVLCENDIPVENCCLLPLEL